MVLLSWMLMLVTQLSRVTAEQGGQETEESLSMHTFGTMFNSIRNLKHNEERIDRKDVFLGESLNQLKDILLKPDYSLKNIAAEWSDTDSECNEINCDDDHFVRKAPVMDITGKVDKILGLDEIKRNGEYKHSPLDNTTSDDQTEDPVVTTRLGQIRGLTLDKAYVFYGIPYADPPVGVKRWASTSPVSPWTYVYDATFPRPACMQVCAEELSESCPSKVLYPLSSIKKQFFD